jgi:hypothetical protein
MKFFFWLTVITSTHPFEHGGGRSPERSESPEHSPTL